jgi:LPS sulfotransferase NodH
VISHARTGSNYLLEGINSSKSVLRYHEIFAEHNREKGKDFDRILSKLYQKQNKMIRAVGFKLFYYHLTNEEWEKFLQHEDFKIIHLIRTNRLRTLVSLEIAYKTDHWISTAKKDNLHAKIIKLNPDTIMKNIKNIEAFENTITERYKNRKLLTIVYEDLVKDKASEFKRVGEFLGVTNLDLGKIYLEKQNPEDLSLLISNFDEISQILKSSRFAEYLYT